MYNIIIDKTNNIYAKQKKLEVYGELLLMLVVNLRIVGGISRSKKAHALLKKDEGFVETSVMADMEPNYVQKKVDQYFKNR